MDKIEIISLTDEQLETIVAADNGNHYGNGNGHGKPCDALTTLACGEEGACSAC